MHRKCTACVASAWEKCVNSQKLIFEYPVDCLIVNSISVNFFEDHLVFREKGKKIDPYNIKLNLSSFCFPFKTECFCFFTGGQLGALCIWMIAAETGILCLVYHSEEIRILWYSTCPIHPRFHGKFAEKLQRFSVGMVPKKGDTINRAICHLKQKIPRMQQKTSL